MSLLGNNSSYVGYEKRTTVSSAQSSYTAMGLKMADKADPSQELSVTMRAGHCCRIVGWKSVAFSRHSQFTSLFWPR